MGAMRIVLIGGTGVISSAVASEAVARGHDVTLVNRGRSTVRPVPDGVRVITADARDPHALRAALGRREFDVAADFTVFTPDHARNDIDTFRGRTGRRGPRPPLRLRVLRDEMLSSARPHDTTR